jgi:hypothetical protein
VKLVGDVGNWKIVAHIAFKFYSVASGTFSTGSTLGFRRAAPAASVCKPLLAGTAYCPPGVIIGL